MNKLIKRESGFTLIEVLIVVVILGFLASTVGPELFGKVSQAKQTTAQNQLDVFKLALDSYRLDNGRYPSTEQGLEALVEEPSISPTPNNWNGPYLDDKQVPLDPWGNPYNYKNPGEHNQHKYDLWSYGLDNQEGGTKESTDVTNW
jgi:general secretion pathway protein G